MRSMVSDLFLYLLLTLAMSVFLNCSDVSGPGAQTQTRDGSIPDGAVKVTPETDLFPPVIHSSDWSDPVPLPGPVNTAGVEDAPVISADGSIFLFFFTPDGNIPPDEQILDGISGIWWCKNTGSGWTEPVRAELAADDVDHLDGSLAFTDNTLWFCSIRSGNYRTVDIYTAEYTGADWTNWQNAGQQINQEYQMGELCATSDGDTVYYGSTLNGYGQSDLWCTVKDGAGWSTPVNLGPELNTAGDESRPCVSPDGNELLFTRSVSGMGYYGPAIFRSIRTAGVWGEPEEVVSSYAGDPGIDQQGNLYFTHLYLDAEGNKIEADIYISYRN